MSETKHNTKLKNSLKKYFKDIWAIKYHAGTHGMGGIPDVIGCHKGQFFSIEGKMLKPLKKKKLTIASRDGNICGCSDLQIATMKQHAAAGAVVLMAYYRHFSGNWRKNGLYLIPKSKISTPEQVEEFKTTNNFDKYFCSYVGGQVYDIKKLFTSYLKDRAS